MKTKPQIATVSKIISAPVEEIYRIIADYRTLHPFILPKGYFISLEVEEGGFGNGTIINFKMRILGQTRSFRSLITEPEPGRLLVETDIKSETPTSFRVASIGNDRQTRVTISTELKGRNVVEGLIAKMILQKIYREELDLLATMAENHAEFIWSDPANKTSSTSS